MHDRRTDLVISQIPLFLRDCEEHVGVTESVHANFYMPLRKTQKCCLSTVCREAKGGAHCQQSINNLYNSFQSFCTEAFFLSTAVRILVTAHLQHQKGWGKWEGRKREKWECVLMYINRFRTYCKHLRLDALSEPETDFLLWDLITRSLSKLSPCSLGWENRRKQDASYLKIDICFCLMLHSGACDHSKENINAIIARALR